MNSDAGTQELLLPVFQGIIDRDYLPSPNFQGFYEFNFWGGRIHETDQSDTHVFAGLNLYNPSRGEILVFDKDNPNGKFYSTPTATGPVCITREKDGILTLVSLKGKYKAHDPRKDTNQYVRVTARGGKIYCFDLKTRTFKN